MCGRGDRRLPTALQHMMSGHRSSDGVKTRTLCVSHVAALGTIVPRKGQQGTIKTGARDLRPDQKVWKIERLWTVGTVGTQIPGLHMRVKAK